MRGSCILVPKVTLPDGTETPSKLYQELSKNKNLAGQRPIVNYIYALYLQSGDTAMDTAGFTARDENGEHLAKDVYKFYNISDILIEQADDRTIKNAKVAVGAINSSGDIVYYDNGKEALDKIVDFNSKNRALVARLVKEGTKYTISLENRNSRSQWQIGKAEEQAKLYQTVKEAFNDVGYNLDALSVAFPQLFNIADIANTINYLKSFQKTNVGYATQNEISFMLNLLPSSDTKLARIISKC